MTIESMSSLAFGSFLVVAPVMPPKHGQRYTFVIRDLEGRLESIAQVLALDTHPVDPPPEPIDLVRYEEFLAAPTRNSCVFDYLRSMTFEATFDAPLAPG